MEFEKIIQRALEIRKHYAELEKKKYGAEWDNKKLLEGVGKDFKDLADLILTKERGQEPENFEAKISHELSDCLWSVLILANRYSIDMEASFLKTMDDLEKRIDEEMKL